MRALLTICIIALFAITAAAQTADTTASEKFFVMSSAGWGPETGARGEGSVGVRVTENVYSLTTMNAAGGVGAVVQDLLSKLATTRGVTLWGRAGAGATTTNLPDGTDYSLTFGGGVMLTYDLSLVSHKLRNFEAIASVKAMYAPYVSPDGVTGTAVRPQYMMGLKFNWPEE